MFSNLVIGLLTMAFCLGLQCLGVSALLHYLHRLKERGRIASGVVTSALILAVSMMILMIGNLLQIAVWAVLFMVCGEFTIFAEAFYHSAVNFSTLGYGDIVMSESRRLLGALEAANGVLMFGLTTSVMFWLIQAFIRQYHATKTEGGQNSD